MSLAEAEAHLSAGFAHRSAGRNPEALAELNLAVETARQLVVDGQARHFALIGEQRFEDSMAVLEALKPARRLLARARDARLELHRSLHGGPPDEPATAAQIAEFRRRLDAAFARLKPANILGVPNVREAPSSAGYEASELARKAGAATGTNRMRRGSGRAGSSTSASVPSRPPDTLAVGRAVAAALRQESLAVEWLDDEGLAIVTWMPRTATTEP